MEFWWDMVLTIFPANEARKSSSKLRRKFATSFAEIFANSLWKSLVLKNHNLIYAKYIILDCRKWGCNKSGLKGCVSGRPSWKSAEIGLFRRFSAFSPFFPEGPKSTWEILETEEKGLFPQISSDFPKPPSLKPPFAALQIIITIMYQEKASAEIRGEIFPNQVLGEFCGGIFFADIFSALFP